MDQKITTATSLLPISIKIGEEAPGEGDRAVVAMEIQTPTRTDLSVRSVTKWATQLSSLLYLPKETVIWGGMRLRSAMASFTRTHLLSSHLWLYQSISIRSKNPFTCDWIFYFPPSLSGSPLITTQ